MSWCTGIHRPDQFAQSFGRAGCSIARDSIKSDARVGEHLRFVMTGPGMRYPVDMVFTEVEASGVPGVAGSRLVHLRLKFHDERNDKTRLELRQPVRRRPGRRGRAQSGWESSARADRKPPGWGFPRPGSGGCSCGESGPRSPSHFMPAPSGVGASQPASSWLIAWGGNAPLARGVQHKEWPGPADP